MHKHSEEVKVIVVNRYLNGESISKISHDLNISRTTVYTWIKQHNNSFNKAGIHSIILTFYLKIHRYEPSPL